MTDTSKPIVEKNVECVLSDGTILRSDVYRPDTNDTYPVLMIRLPYDKETPRYYDEYLSVPRMVAAGYVVVLQDVRGRFASHGEFYPFIDEGKDGYEAVEWAAKLPYANGLVGLFGMSYHGYTQLAAVAEQPPSLKAVAPVMTLAEPWNDMVKGNNGANNIGNLQTWTLASMVVDQLKRKNPERVVKAYEYMQELPKWLSKYPAIDWEPMKELDPDSFYFDLVNENVSEEFKKTISLSERLQKTTIPALFMGGWFDALLKPTLQAYQTYAGEKMLWIGPWTHEEMTGQAGEKFFQNGEKNIGVEGIKDPTELHIMWFDKWLKDKPFPIKDNVHLYLTGQEKWESYDTWPIDTNKETWYLISDGDAKTRSGDGVLSRESQNKITTNQLQLDPANPVPTHGGGVLLAGVPSAMAEQGVIQDRDDVLVFTSEPLDHDLDVLGTVKAAIWASSPSPLLDLFVQVSDVEPSGKVYNVIDTYQREQVERDLPVHVDMIVNDTAYRFRKGHQIRVTIAASNAPYFDVNLNNGETSLTNADGVANNEIIYHGGEYDTMLILPVH